MKQVSDSRAKLRVDVRDGSPRTTIEARDLEATLLERLADNQLRMPPYPAIALKLQQLAECGRSSTGEIAATISADAALVAAVLRRANAAVYDAAQQVVSLDIAISRLGLEQIVQIAIAQSVGLAMNTAGPLRTLRRDVWRRSLLTAAIASELAPSRGVDRDTAFVAGLLHDFGAITVLVGLEDLEVELPVLSAVTWRRFVERIQPPFGRVFAQRWRLPEPIADAIEHWAQPRSYDGAHRPLVDAIASAVAIISTLDSAPAEGIESLQHVEGLSRTEAERVHHLVPRIAELMNAFEQSSPPAAARATAINAVEIVPVPDVLWPIDVAATCKGEPMRACAIDHKTVVLAGAQPMEPNWLVQVVLQADQRIDILANVTACTAEPDGTHRIVARPFGLGGDHKEAWFALVQRARAAAQDGTAAQPGAATPADPAPTRDQAGDIVVEVEEPSPPGSTPVSLTSEPQREVAAPELPHVPHVSRGGGGVTLATGNRRSPLVPIVVLGALAGVLIGVGSAVTPQALGVWIAIAVVLGAAGVVWSARLSRTVSS